MQFQDLPNLADNTDVTYDDIGVVVREVVAVYTDNGVSGAKGREQRPGLDELLKGVARREFDVVAAWSVDRLGRSLQDLIGTLNELRAKDVDLYLHKQGLDTGTPAGTRATTYVRSAISNTRMRSTTRKRTHPSHSHISSSSGSWGGLLWRWLVSAWASRTWHYKSPMKASRSHEL